MNQEPQKRPVIRALTLYQPWAWAVAAGHKTVENRPWKPWAWLMKPDVEAWIAIHAGSTYDEEGESFLRRRGVPLPSKESRTKGAILGIGRLVGCVTESSDPMFFGPFGWLFDNLRLLPAPIQVKGQMGLWEVSADIALALNEVIKSKPVDALSDSRQIGLFAGVKP